MEEDPQASESQQMSHHIERMPHQGPRNRQKAEVYLDIAFEDYMVS